MVVLVILLIVTNLVTIGLLAYVAFWPPGEAGPDPRLAQALDGSLPRTVSATGTRRVISVEVLNVIELARTRGRLAGLAGSLVPGLTARIVYDQTIKTMRRQLVEEQVVADVRLHTLRPLPPARPAKRALRAAEPTSVDDPPTLDEPGPAVDAAVPEAPAAPAKDDGPSGRGWPRCGVRRGPAEGWPRATQRAGSVAVRCQGRSCSSSRAIAISWLSAPGFATSCTARGRPFGASPAGTAIAGQPARFHGAVKGAYREFAQTLRSHPRAAHALALSGGWASAGVSSRS